MGKHRSPWPAKKEEDMPEGMPNSNAESSATAVEGADLGGVVAGPSELSRVIHASAAGGFANPDDFDEASFGEGTEVPSILPEILNGVPMKYGRIGIDDFRRNPLTTASEGRPLMTPVTRLNFPKIPAYSFNSEGFLQDGDTIWCACVLELWEKRKKAMRRRMDQNVQSIIRNVKLEDANSVKQKGGLVGGITRP